MIPAMSRYTKDKLLRDYVKRLKFVYMPFLKNGAFNRFDIRDGKIVSISRFSQIYAIITILIIDITGFLLLYETTVKKKMLILPEFLSVVEFNILNNLALININFLNRHSGAELIMKFIEIDVFMGIKETKFMRDIADREVLIWVGSMATFEVLLLITISYTFPVPLYVFLIGILYFKLQLGVIYDHSFHVVAHKMLALRLHYLNVSLVKLANLNTEYLMDQLLSYPFLWKKEYDDLVVQSGLDTKYFTGAYKMLFDQLQRVSKCYRYLVFYGTASLVLSTLVAVQTVIMFIKDSELQLIRTFSLTAWCCLNWFIIVGIIKQTDKFGLQIKRTKLICTYIQLKPNYSDGIFHLAQSILDLLEVSDYRVSIYDIFYFNESLLRSVATSVFIFITMQLQIAFPKRNDHYKDNTKLSLSTEPNTR